MTSLLDELRIFLRSVKTSEALSDELRQAISIDTGVEQPLADAIASGSTVFVAGSAGGGKTHLLRMVQQTFELPLFIEFPDEPEPAHERFVRVVSDMTAVPSRQGRLRTATETPRNCVSVVLAINEGVLLQLARAEKQSTIFSDAVRLLHDGQRGVTHEHSPEQPVVLDVGGYDPLENGVVARLVEIPLLSELVDESDCSCESEAICPRRLAWQLLESKDVRERLNDLIRVVALQGHPVLFRDLWDFISDLVLGGSCEGETPTSPWFWRVFHGSSQVSRRLREIADPDHIVIPRAEAHIWYGDFLSPEIPVIPEVDLLPLDADPPLSLAAYRWMKCQLFFLVASASALDVLRDQIDLQLASAIAGNRTHEIVEALNAYMTYDTVVPSQTVLDLWADMGIERRLDRARGQVSLGAVRVEDLVLSRSRVVLNHPHGDMSVLGSRTYLLHSRSGATFLLSGEVLGLLRSGRSFRTSDRPHTDMEWQIGRFFSRIGRSLCEPDSLEVLQLDFETMTGRRHSYRQSTALGQIEPSGDLS